MQTKTILSEAVSHPIGVFPTTTTGRWPLGSHLQIRKGGGQASLGFIGGEAPAT